MKAYDEQGKIKELKSLWKDTFRDSDAYLELFFRIMYQEENTLVQAAGGHIISALYLIPYDVKLDGKTERAAYLYALATRPDYRSRGMMGELIRKAQMISKERGYAFTFLIPAQESLIAYYARFGYEPMWRAGDPLQAYEASDLPKLYWRLSGQPLCPVPFYSVYQACKEREGNGIRLSRKQSSFYLDALRLDGGEVWIGSREGIPQAEPSEYALLIRSHRHSCNKVMMLDASFSNMNTYYCRKPDMPVQDSGNGKTTALIQMLHGDMPKKLNLAQIME